jgi:hypothetical protein
MAIRMIRPAVGVANGMGSVTRTYAEGEELSDSHDWEKARNADFMARGLAEETKVVEPTETKADAPQRARNDDGTLKGDDPSTPDVNEAWEGGQAPKKRGRPKKSS